jgi:hypothetical protein
LFYKIILEILKHLQKDQIIIEENDDPWEYFGAFVKKNIFQDFLIFIKSLMRTCRPFKKA